MPAGISVDVEGFWIVDEFGVPVSGGQTAAHRAGSLTSDISISLNESLNDLARRGQQAGRVRADLVADDLPRLIGMLYSVLSTMDSTSRGWRRYVALILDAISTNERQPLPPAPAFRYASEPNSWPL